MFFAVWRWRVLVSGVLFMLLNLSGCGKDNDDELWQNVVALDSAGLAELCPFVDDGATPPAGLSGEYQLQLFVDMAKFGMVYNLSQTDPAAADCFPVTSDPGDDVDMIRCSTVLFTLSGTFTSDGNAVLGDRILMLSQALLGQPAWPMTNIAIYANMNGILNGTGMVDFEPIDFSADVPIIRQIDAAGTIVRLVSTPLEITHLRRCAEDSAKTALTASDTSVVTILNAESRITLPFYGYTLPGRGRLTRLESSTALE